MIQNKSKDLIKKHANAICCCIFIICVLARVFEYFFIKTDETFWAENFLHKAFGIVLLSLILAFSKKQWKEIGFTKSGMIANLIKGLTLGLACFVIAFGVEHIVLYLMNGSASFEFYESGFALNGETQKHTEIVFILMCVLLNIINVWMEEGIFRGLFTKILEDKTRIKKIGLIAFLFGIWHLVMPLRDYLEAKTSITELLVMGIGYIILAGIMSVKWSLLYEMTGSLWMGIGDHLFNNIIVTNLVHVVSNGEADSMQIVRIVIGQLLSFAIVIAAYRKRKMING